MSKEQKYKKALENIKKHQELVAKDSYRFSMTWIIAENALRDVGKTKDKEK